MYIRTQRALAVGVSVEDKHTSKTYEYPYGQITVHDIRMLPDLVLKANPTYLEALLTNYYTINPVHNLDQDAQTCNDFVMWLRERVYNVETVCYKKLVCAMMGMVHNKAHCLHNQGTIPDDKWKGYDPKQVHHALRLVTMMNLMDEGKKFHETLVLDKDVRKELMNIKLNGVGDVEEANEYMKQIVALADKQCDEVVKTHELDQKAFNQLAEGLTASINGFIVEEIKQEVLASCKEAMEVSNVR